MEVDKTKLKEKSKTIPEPEQSNEKESRVSAGAVDKAIDLAFNPTREKIREVTIIDRLQGRLFPLLDVINEGRQYIMEVALYRQDAEEYERLFEKKRPVAPNMLDEFMYRTAQWQKSVQGTNLGKITDIALAETETRVQEDEDKYGDKDIWADK